MARLENAPVAEATRCHSLPPLMAAARRRLAERTPTSITELAKLTKGDAIRIGTKRGEIFVLASRSLQGRGARKSGAGEAGPC